MKHAGCWSHVMLGLEGGPQDVTCLPLRTSVSLPAECCPVGKRRSWGKALALAVKVTLKRQEHDSKSQGIGFVRLVSDYGVMKHRD